VLDTAKILTNVASVNNFDQGDSAFVRVSNPASIYLRLWQTDKAQRYIPAAGASLQVLFLRGTSVSATPTSQTVQIVASAPYTDDRSIWKVDLTSTQVDQIVSGGMQLSLTESAVTTTYFVKDVIVKVPVTGS
jgi:hypothetical protein